MEAVTWWNINDKDSFIVSGGLLDEDNIPKASYFTLQDLITGWTSSGQEITDMSGQAPIRGYGGEYELIVSYSGQTRQETARIVEQKYGEIIIHFDKK